MTSETPENPSWLLYGANGYTGRLIAAAATREGLRPVLSGRNRSAIEEMGRELNLPSKPADLDSPADLRAAVRGHRLVLHCAGPFARTSAAMLDACLAEGAHYADITGEIDVFASCHARSDEASGRSLCVIPGSGFDVVPTDCVAATLKSRLAAATSLTLAFEAGGGPSVGTARTGAAGLAKGGRVRRGGKLVSVPLAWKSRTFVRDGTPRSAMTIPWGDVYTAFVSTGIPDIEVYMCVPPRAIQNARRLNLVRPLLGLGLFARLLERRVAASVHPPSPEKRASTNARIWGEAVTASGERALLEIETPNGYDLTVTAALGIVKRLLREPRPTQTGFLTPSQLMGASYVFGLPGVREIRAS